MLGYLHNEELQDIFLAKHYAGDEIKEAERRQGMRHILVRKELPALFWWENLKSRRHLQNLGADESTLHRRILNIQVQKLWN